MQLGGSKIGYLQETLARVLAGYPGNVLPNRIIHLFDSRGLSEMESLGVLTATAGGYLIDCDMGREVQDSMASTASEFLRLKAEGAVRKRIADPLEAALFVKANLMDSVSHLPKEVLDKIHPTAIDDFRGSGWLGERSSVNRLMLSGYIRRLQAQRDKQPEVPVERKVRKVTTSLDDVRGWVAKLLRDAHPRNGKIRREFYAEMPADIRKELAQKGLFTGDGRSAIVHRDACQKYLEGTIEDMKSAVASPKPTSFEPKAKDPVSEREREGSWATVEPATVAAQPNGHVPIGLGGDTYRELLRLGCVDWDGTCHVVGNVKAVTLHPSVTTDGGAQLRAEVTSDEGGPYRHLAITQTMLQHLLDYGQGLLRATADGSISVDYARLSLVPSNE